MTGPPSESEAGSASASKLDAEEDVLVPPLGEVVSVYLKGLFMGMADTVPGVSGGTIALVTGIYERMIAAITAVDPRDARHLLRVHTGEGRKDLRATLVRIDVGFLVALGLGVVTAVVTVAQVIEVVAEEYPGPLGAFFFGLIAASAVVLYSEIDLSSPRLLAVGATGVVFAVGIVGITAGNVTHAAPMVFVAGAIAICAMILPGVSGAFLLLVLGQYEYMLSVLNAFVESVVAVPSGGSVSPVLSNGGTVGVFLTGAVIGLFTVSHAINWALERYRIATLTFLVSLMVGGLRLPAERICQHALLDVGSGGGHVQSTGCLPELATNPGAASLTLAELVPLLAAGLFGALAVLAFDRFTDDLDYA